jgi:ubiquinone/menaquinone biosynthesis C-methylase UbiE
MEDRPRLYGDLASWFHLVTAPEEYAHEASVYRRLISEGADRPVAVVLELGSGGGNNASHLKEHFEMTLSDVASEMLELSRELNPECEHIEGDMRTLRLDHSFDAVFVHDAIDYLLNEKDLRATIETAFVHLRPGGVALFVPDHIRETFRPATEHGGNDGPTRSARYLEWSWDPDPEDDTYVTDFAFLLRDERGDVRVELDRHVLGIHSRARWMELLAEAGFAAESRTVNLGEDEPTEVFLGRKLLEG